jgi:hypothetical protein
MFKKKKFGFGESEYEHFPDGFKLPKMPLPGELKKAIEKNKQAESEAADETAGQQDEPDKK